jgi:beta-glucuronidase
MVIVLANLGPYLEEMRAGYPRQALMVTEFGAEAVKPGPPTERATYAFQSSYLGQTLGILSRERWLAGAIYFTARDFAIKPYWGRRPPAARRTRLDPEQGPLQLHRSAEARRRRGAAALRGGPTFAR